MTRVMCLDYGEKRIGVAISDESQLIAQPLQTIDIKTLASVFSIVADLVKKYQVSRIVIGLPLNMNASEGEAVNKTRQFSEALSQVVETPIEFWDERLSSASAENMLIQGNIGRARRKQYRDKIAASLILESYLEYKRFFAKHNDEK